MNDSTKEYALNKLQCIYRESGLSRQMEHYSALEIDRGHIAGDHAFQFGQRQLAKIGQP